MRQTQFEFFPIKGHTLPMTWEQMKAPLHLDRAIIANEGRVRDGEGQGLATHPSPDSERGSRLAEGRFDPAEVPVGAVARIFGPIGFAVHVLWFRSIV